MWMCDYSCNTNMSAGIIWVGDLCSVSCPSQKPGVCCIGNTDHLELVRCPVQLPTTLDCLTALRTSRDFLSSLTLNSLVNSSLKMLQ